MSSNPTGSASDLAFEPSWGIESPATTVFDFDYATVHSGVAAIFGKDIDIGKGVTDLLVTYLVKDGTYSVIERKALDKLGLVPEIRDAIVFGVGPLGALLAIAEAAEAGDAERLAESAQHTHSQFAVLTPEVLAELNLAALAWFGVQPAA